MSQNLFNFDNDLRNNKNISIICGIDETGRGCWAGPLVAAAVIFKKDDFIGGINDSKKLSKNQLIDFDQKIKNNCLSWGISSVDCETIDKKGITYANIKAMNDAAIEACKKINMSINDVDLFVIDQSPCKNLNPHLMMPKADSISASVAAASILAKNFRDKIIENISIDYPHYNFQNHNGYINKNHVDAVKKHGLIKNVHRKSFNVNGFNKSKQINLMELIDNEN